MQTFEDRQGEGRRFEGDVAIVTGGARGIGEACARAMVAEGGRVVVADVLEDEGKRLADDLGEAATFVALDVTDEAAWADAVRIARDTYGPVTILVNNAGILDNGPIDAMTPAAFRRVIDVNLTSCFLGIQAVLPAMKDAGGGAIVNISSTAGLMGYAYLSAYVASKWGVRGLTKAAALELGPAGIRVNSVHPGPITTPMTDGIGDEVALGQPIPRFGTPAEVAAVVCFLTSDAASYCTGGEYTVDGGQVTGSVVASLE